MLKNLELRAEEMLRWRVVSKKTTLNDAAQQAAAAKLQRKVECCKGLENGVEKSNRAGSSGHTG